MGNIKLGLIGAGLRGSYTHAKNISENIKGCELVSIVEKRKGRRESISKKYNIRDEYAYESIEEFLKQDKFLDGIIIASGDDNHYNHINLLLEKGYNILVELPLANTLDRLIKVNNLNEIYNDILIMSCNTFRYNKMFIKIKEIIQSNRLGKIISIQYNQNIGHEEYSHNYVRGNWRIDSDTSPLILNKSCQDIDILSYLLESKCDKITSFGDLKYMNNKSFKLNMGENCFQCSVENKCPYSSKKIYMNDESKLKQSVHINPTQENLATILTSGPYGRCVYRCDNNVVDNMINILHFKNGVNASLNINAYTKHPSIDIKILFTEGSLEANSLKQEIRTTEFVSQIENVIKIEENNINIQEESEVNLLKDFVSKLSTKDFTNNRSSLVSSIDSHIIAFAGEYSRVISETIDIQEFYDIALETTFEIEKALL